MKFETHLLNIDYPLYGAKFYDDNILIVAGGGGEGNHGIPNKISVLKVDFPHEHNAENDSKKGPIRIVTELKLKGEDDSPTALDITNKGTILLGCNENSEKIQSGKGNNNIRKFQLDVESPSLKFVESVDLDKFTSPDDYTKFVYTSTDGSIAAIASSTEPAVIRILNTDDLSEIYEIDSAHEVKDLHFSPNGKMVAIITDSTLEIISTVTGSSIMRKVNFDNGLHLSKIRFMDDDSLVVASSSHMKYSKGVVMTKLSLKSGAISILNSKLITTRVKGVTALDVDPKGQLAALAGNDNSITLINLRNLSVAKVFQHVHTFAITRITFSKNSKYVVSVSAGNTIHAVKIPEKLADSLTYSEFISKWVINFVMVVILSYLIQYGYQNNVPIRVYNCLKDLRINFNSSDGLDSFNDYFKQTTLIGNQSSLSTSSVTMHETFNSVIPEGTITSTIAEASVTQDLEPSMTNLPEQEYEELESTTCLLYTSGNDNKEWFRQLPGMVGSR